MGFFTKLLRRNASVRLAERHGQAVLSFRYGGGLAPYGDVAARWPELAPLAPYVLDAARLLSPVPPDRLPGLLAALEALGGVPRLDISVADAVLAPKAPSGAPEPGMPEPEAAEPEPPQPSPPRREALTGEQLERLRAEIEAGGRPDVPGDALLSLFGALALEPGVDNFPAMAALWRDYIDRRPELAGLPARWIWDYTRVRGLGIAPEALLAALPGLPDPVLDAALTALEQSGAPLRVPVWVLSRLSRYDIAASRFYKSFGDKPALEALFSDAVAAVDAALREAEGRGLLSARCLARLRTQEVAAFRGIPGAGDVRYTLNLRLFHKNPRLQTYLKLLLRCVENGLRARYRYSGRLQGDGPDETSRSAVEAFLAQLPPAEKPRRDAAEPAPAPKAPIALNMADVARLRADSDAARAALLAAVARDAWPEAEGTDDGAPPPEPAAAAPDEGGRPTSPWDAFLARADREALTALAAGPDALRALASARREMPERLLDALNEAAADTLGDLIADGDGVFEEYRGVLAERLGGA